MVLHIWEVTEKEIRDQNGTLNFGDGIFGWIKKILFDLSVLKKMLLAKV